MHQSQLAFFQAYSAHHIGQRMSHALPDAMAGEGEHLHDVDFMIGKSRVEAIPLGLRHEGVRLVRHAIRKVKCTAGKKKDQI